MTPEQETNFRKWMTALRSGRFPQGFGDAYNANTGKFCAFGVARFVTDNLAVEFNTSVAFGITQDGRRSIIYLNDTKKLPFRAIADEIEKHKAEWFA